MNRNSSLKHAGILKVTLLALAGAIVLLSFVSSTTATDGEPLDISGLLFQSSLPEPEEIPDRPGYWVYAGEGGVRAFGDVTVSLPPGFTSQGGASVIGDMIYRTTGIEGENMVPGTEFALGIWPPNDQTDYDTPIELRIAMNPAQIPNGDAATLAIAQYDPATESWLRLPSAYLHNTEQMTAKLDHFTPVPKDFADWGGRSFFAVIKVGLEAEEAVQPGATVRTPSNIREGPSTRFRVIRVAARGESVNPIAKSPDGRWLQLEDGGWIAAFLVADAPNVPVVEDVPILPTATSSRS